MQTSPPPLLRLSRDACDRAVNSRDPRFDGLFFVGITTTSIYCRPVCPARVSYPERRRFFHSAAAAERAGYRPCLRCRPELAPGHAGCDAISQLAAAAARHIAAGALNGRSVAELARDLGVSERHLRRACERELGVAPLDLARTHRLLLAKRLLADTGLPVTHIAFASGFQSLRRFNSVFLEQYRMSPSELRGRSEKRIARSRREGSPDDDLLRLTLSYRPPVDWTGLLADFAASALPGVEMVEGKCYGRTVCLDGRTGVVFASLSDAGDEDLAAGGNRPSRTGQDHVTVAVSMALVPVLMPLLARVRRMLDLDAEPAVVERHLAEGGLARLVELRPGLRLPGAWSGFDVVLTVLLEGASGEVIQELGDPITTGIAGLTHLAPTARQVLDAGAARLRQLGVPLRRAEVTCRVAAALVDGWSGLEPGHDPVQAHRALVNGARVSDHLAKRIVARALYWPDAFSAADPALQQRAGVATAGALTALAELWRPWRAYAALQLSVAQSSTTRLPPRP